MFSWWYLALPPDFPVTINLGEHVLSWVCAFDLETIPCTETLARLHGLESCDDAKAEELLGSKFPKLPLHRVAVIAALLAERVDGAWKVRSLGAPHIGQRSEAALIEGFSERVATLKPTLVTFNGTGFDLPVLRYRAMVNGIPASGLMARRYFARYDESHIDLCDVLANFDARGKVGLDDLCKMMGLPGKPQGIDGSKVWQAYREGRLQEVADYGETDVVNTYRVWLRHELFKGALSPDQLVASEDELTDYVRARQGERPNLSYLLA